MLYRLAVVDRKIVTVQVATVERAAPMDRDSKQLARFHWLRVEEKPASSRATTRKQAERLRKFMPSVGSAVLLEVDFSE